MIEDLNLSSSITTKAYATNTPLYFLIELSQKCNLICSHCYNFDRSTTSQKNNWDSLSDAEVLAAIEHLKELGCLYVGFTGGEPLLHPRLNLFIKKARELQMAVRLKTNGMLLTPERAAELVSLGVYLADVSVYGATPATHELITQVPGSFSRTINGLKNAIQAGMMPSISFIMHKNAAAEAKEMVELGKSLGCKFQISFEMTARHDGTSSSLDHRLTQDQIKEMYQGALAWSVPYLKNKKETMSCGCARTNGAIASNGDVYPCIGAPIRSGNIREQSLTEIWKTSPQFLEIRGHKMKDFKTCAPCDLKDYCQRSSGATFVTTGNYTGVDTWNCRTAETLKAVYKENIKSGEFHHSQLQERP